MIDISKLRYGLVGYTPSGQQIHLDQNQRGVSLSEPAGEIAVRLQVEMLNQKVNGTWLHELLPLGAPILFYEHHGDSWNQVFDGKIWTHNPKSNPLNKFLITAYDGLYNILKSKDDRYYSAGTTGRAMIEDTCREWGIPLGQMDGPGVPLDKRPVRGEYIGDFFLSVLEESRLKGAGRFFLRFQNGKFHCLKPGQNSTVYYFGDEQNVAQVEDEQTMDNLVTRVKIIGAENDQARSPVEATVNGKTEFGVFQELVYKSQYKTYGEAETAAKSILSDRGNPKRRQVIDAPDLPFLRKGDKVYVTAGTLNGYYIAFGIDHDPDQRRMQVEVEPV